MTAKQLTKTHGASLIGRRIETEAIGEYSGGIATVTEIAPDPQAPEIVFNVRHPTYGEIGVFKWEQVTLLPGDAGGVRRPGRVITTTTRRPAGVKAGVSSPSRKEP
jgi:hypothetical protein